MSALHVACILEQETYKPGDQAPEGYLAWHEWAEVQHKAGLRQKQCGRCGLWRYPQQLSATVDRTEVTGLRKRQPFRRTLETPVCNDCNKTPNAKLTGPRENHGDTDENHWSTEPRRPRVRVERPVRPGAGARRCCRAMPR